MSDANSVQHGGSHYKSQVIQVWDYVTSNNIPYLEGNAIKYLSRWRSKGGIEDLLKARHYIDKIIENERQRLEGATEEAKPDTEPVFKIGTEYVARFTGLAGDARQVVFNSMGDCKCDCATECPLGRTGMESRCKLDDVRKHLQAKE